MLETRKDTESSFDTDYENDNGYLGELANIKWLSKMLNENYLSSIVFSKNSKALQSANPDV